LYHFFGSCQEFFEKFLIFSHFFHTSAKSGGGAGGLLKLFVPISTDAHTALRARSRFAFSLTLLAARQEVSNETRFRQAEIASLLVG
jgi:hypothetical protein